MSIFVSIVLLLMVPVGNDDDGDDDVFDGSEHRLPRDFDYHRIPAPWIQMNLLRILAILGTADAKASEVSFLLSTTCCHPFAYRVV